MGMNSDVTFYVADYVKDAPNVYLDTSCTPNEPESVFVVPIRTIPNRVLFGSDGPTLSVEAELRKLEVAEELYGLTPDEKPVILGGNAAGLFRLDVETSRRV
jgi:predicted TIM-barrel fold metal-dependent hydrolase